MRGGRNLIDFFLFTHTLGILLKNKNVLLSNPYSCTQLSTNRDTWIYDFYVCLHSLFKKDQNKR